ncbi:MAG: stage III sporulation protein AG [Oscillospiraceae bacterium]|nr:stage III sporulation protein AG [Oscillospiraceae bacterium]
MRTYKYPILTVLAGLVILLLPTADKAAPEPKNTAQVVPATTVEERLERILSGIEGAGTVQVLLTEESGRQTLYQTDVQSDETRRTEDTVLVEDAERRETGLVRQTLEPRYRGAVVLCDGADSSAVKLAIVEAVGCVTGLGADRICVLKRQ